MLRQAFRNQHEGTVRVPAYLGRVTWAMLRLRRPGFAIQNVSIFLVGAHGFKAIILVVFFTTMHETPLVAPISLQTPSLRAQFLPLAQVGSGRTDNLSLVAQVLDANQKLQKQAIRFLPGPLFSHSNPRSFGSHLFSLNFIIIDCVWYVHSLFLGISPTPGHTGFSSPRKSRSRTCPHRMSRHLSSCRISTQYRTYQRIR